MAVSRAARSRWKSSPALRATPKIQTRRYCLSLCVAAAQQAFVSEGAFRLRRRDDRLEVSVEGVLVEHVDEPTRAGLGEKRR